MSNESGLSVTKPTSILKKSIDLNWRDLFKATGKAGVDAIFGKWDSLAGDAVEVLGALGLKAETGAVGWLLIYRSLLRAMEKLVKETELVAKQLNLKELQAQINQALENSSLEIDDKFFRHPGQASILELIQPAFRDWLKKSGLTEAEAGAVSQRLPSYFVYALHEEWGSHPKDYAVIQENLDTPFTQAQERERSWLRYGAWLQEQVQMPMFAEAFSLQQVFVPLRAYYNDGNVVELETELDSWLTAADKNDGIRLVSGGPGSGKSSLTKMWAAKLAEQGRIKVLFIPLHHFEPTADLVDAVGKFLQTGDFLPVNPLFPDHREERLLIIFDGLDELAMQGKIGERTAQDFVGEVKRTVDLINYQKICVHVLISGRELVVQASESIFRKEKQVLHVLPYFLSKNECKKYTDPQNLLAQDQRQLWWQSYGKVSGKDYSGLPAELDKENLREITAQPLLNYLVALSLRRGELDFSEETNLNAVYDDLLTAIYDRGWDNCRQHRTLEDITENDFQLILEEIALAVWHSNGRTTTVKEIENHCDNSGLKNLLTSFQEGLKENSSTGVTRLLMAFYFRQSGQDAGEKTFEFTHKSFGEYLTAKRIVQEIKLIYEDLEIKKSNFRKGCDEREALRRWALLCGASTMDEYLWKFIFDEVRLVHLQDAAVVATWQQTFCNLIKSMICDGMPMELLRLKDFQEENRQAINAEDSLLAVLGVFQRVTKILSKINFPDPAAFGALLARLQGQRIGNSNPISFHCLSYLDLSGCVLTERGFIGANLVRANLEGANLRGANLEGANLRGANLEGANLLGANLERANLRGANLRGANLLGANLLGANLERANLERASLERANLERANLQGANLRGANLVRADLLEANLRGANVMWTILEGKV